ncbi:MULTISPECIES: outer membrane protein assembly factor BamD [unclassified Desulfurobacterium]|uniref:outer membrane protein assembly factor BamD n=1 Tax=Desulfurobacterium sp. TC5-1 TaxID=1158318 RepID=UPI0003B44DB4|nr:outer membrane protein assembly factor BamD [Desulfurobacterium sp. TC5-1]
MKKILPLLAFILISGCVKRVQTGQELFNKGTEAVKSENWKEAILNLKEALSKDLTPSQKEEAMIMLADAYFKNGNYTDAALEYKEFLNLFPASKFADRALFNLSLCYLQLVKGPQWDQTFTKRALDAINTFIETYPDSPLRSKAEEIRKECRKILAEHIVYIGLTYDMLHQFTASLQRYEEVQNLYSDVEEPDKLLFLIGRARYFIPIQAREKIEDLKEQLDAEKEKLAEAETDEEVKVRDRRISIILHDIENWQKLAEMEREEGEKTLKTLITKYPDSIYTRKARDILKGSEKVEIFPVENPIKKPFFRWFFETL